MKMLALQKHNDASRLYIVVYAIVLTRLGNFLMFSKEALRPVTARASLFALRSWT